MNLLCMFLGHNWWYSANVCDPHLRETGQRISVNRRCRRCDSEEHWNDNGKWPLTDTIDDDTFGYEWVEGYRS